MMPILRFKTGFQSVWRISKNLALYSLLALIIISCSPQPEPSTLHTTGVRAPLLFGPEFEFVAGNKNGPLPQRAYLYANAVRHFSPHLRVDRQHNFPAIWQQTNFDPSHLDRPFDFKGTLDFVSSPEGWPSGIVQASIDTRGMYSTRYGLMKEPPQIGFTFANGEKLNLVYGVDDVFLEGRINPLTIEQSERLKPIIDGLFFNAAKESGLIVPPKGGGHIHIDIERILRRANPIDPTDGLRLIRNFIVDFYTHEHFLSYALRSDERYAQTLGMTSPLDVDDFNRLITDLDKKFLKARVPSFDVAMDLVHAELNRLNYIVPLEVALSDLETRLVFPPGIGLFKPALQFSPEHGTLEIRALYAQKSYQEYIDFAHILTGRLDYLSHETGLLPLISWEDVRLDYREFSKRLIAPKTLGKIKADTLAYLEGAFSQIDPEVKERLKPRVIKYFQDNFATIRCQH